MKKFSTTILFAIWSSLLMAQPVLNSDSLHTGMSFNLYSLTNVNTANISASGAGVNWNVSGTTATLVGTSDFLDMSSTPYAAQYPAANFAMKFTPIGASINYSLFTLSNTALTEVANNVGTIDETPFIDPRETLVFPFTYLLSHIDNYQKTGQGQKIIENTYDSYGTLVTDASTVSDVVRILTVDDGNTAASFWRTAPFAPLFQASSSGFILWELTSSTGISTLISNDLFDMYPNPAINTLHIVNKKPITKIEIINNLGQLQLTTMQSNIDIAKLKSGVYFVNAYTESGIISQKFIKQ